MGSTSAAEIHVYHGDSIQDAINMANPGDTVIVYAGAYTENVDINKKLKIISDSGDPDDVTVQAASPKDHVFYINADNVTVKGFTLRGATQGDSAGTFLDGVQGCTIVNNTLSYNNVGISLRDSDHNKINNNIATRNYHGIEMLWSNENTLNDNIAQNNVLGICLVYSNNNILENIDSSLNRISGIHLVTSSDNSLNNNIASDNAYGIYLDRSHNNKLSGCNISSNNKGIELRNSIKNSIDYNTLSNNKKGIVLRDASSRNRLFQNDFINNEQTAFSNIYNLWNTAESINYYYNSNVYNSYLGNFYSEHTGKDVDSNGISDTPYGKYDSYPLMSPSVDYVITDTKPTPPLVEIVHPIEENIQTSREMVIRELSKSSVEPGEKFTVHITKYNDCLFSQVVETIPGGFSYADSTLDSVAVTEDGNEVSFILFLESSFEYTLIAPNIEGTYKFSGIIRDEDLKEFPIGGDSLIIVEREKR